MLTTGFAVVFGLVFALLVGDLHRRVRARRGCGASLEPVVRLLAAVPSVIYGLIGILVLVPFVSNHLISRGAQGVGAIRRPAHRHRAARAVAILTVMITPIMIAIIVDALRAVPRGWTEGAAALGVNRWRAMWTVSVRAARPAIIAAAVLATRPRAGRGDHALDGLGLGGLRARTRSTA